MKLLLSSICKRKKSSEHHTVHVKQPSYLRSKVAAMHGVEFLAAVEIGLKTGGRGGKKSSVWVVVIDLLGCAADTRHHPVAAEVVTEVGMVSRSVGGVAACAGLRDADVSSVDEDAFQHAVLVDQAAAVVVGGGLVSRNLNGVAGYDNFSHQSCGRCFSP